MKLMKYEETIHNLPAAVRICLYNLAALKYIFAEGTGSEFRNLTIATIFVCNKIVINAGNTNIKDV